MTRARHHGRAQSGHRTYVSTGVSLSLRAFTGLRWNHGAARSAFGPTPPPQLRRRRLLAPDQSTKLCGACVVVCPDDEPVRPAAAHRRLRTRAAAVACSGARQADERAPGVSARPCACWREAVLADALPGPAVGQGTGGALRVLAPHYALLAADATRRVSL
jgi:hypothetical protein